MEKKHIIPVIGVALSLLTITLMYIQYREQRELWAIQKELTKKNLDAVNAVKKV